MKIDVYDTYAPAGGKRLIHFDVLVEHGTKAEKAYHFAKSWLSEIGENADALEQSHCRFCHSDNAPPHMEAAIRKQGYYILQMEGCPNPEN